MSIIDFDKLYEKYVISWALENAGKLQGDLSVEHFIPEIYDGFVNTPIEALGGLKPKDYFAGYAPDELIAALKDYNISNISVPSVLMDSISESTACEGLLCGMISDSKNPSELIMTAINLVHEMPEVSVSLLRLLAGIVTDPAYTDEVREIAVEILTENHSAVKDMLLLKLKVGGLDAKSLVYLADILVNLPENEYVFNLLVKLFKGGTNDPLYAAYLGKYGDTRALQALYERMEGEVNYAEFLEIRNAIERLGGEVTREPDFTDDPFYKALKNIK